MLRSGRKAIVTILTGAFPVLEAAGAAATAAPTPHKPWYAAWYLWIGLGILVIVLISVLGPKERD